MSRRLAFQTQLASIMEVLANAAVAEICKLVDDDYAVVSFQMSQCQRENKALKRKLHLLELKLARGSAERRHRDLTGNHPGNSSRAAGLRAAVEPLQEPLPPAGDVFVQHMEEALWSSRSIGEEAAVPILSDNIQPLSPDVELVKEEKMETNMVPDADPEEGLRLIGDDGVLECSPAGAGAGAGAGAQKCDLEQKDCQSHSKSQTQSSPTKPVSSRGVEKEEPDVVLVKVEEAGPTARTRSQTCLSIQEGLVESSTDDYRGAALLDETTPTSDPPSDLQECGRGFSEVSYGHSSLWTNSGGCYSDALGGGRVSFLPGFLIGADPGSFESGLAAENAAESPLASESFQSFSLEQQIPVIDLSEDTPPMSRSLSSGPNRSAPKSSAPDRKLCTCSFCGKGFRAPANLESHMRTHTGEKPFGCTVCGRKFSQFWNLKIHRNIHTGERPYQCTLCPERFSDPSNLKKHQKRQHPHATSASAQKQRR